MPHIKNTTTFFLLLFCLSSNGQWRTINSGTKLPLRQIIFTDTSNGFILSAQPVMQNGNVLFSTNDGGYHWKPILSNHNIIAIDFLTKEIGAVLCQDTVLKTSDGGKSWATFAVKIDPGSLFHMNSAKEWFFVNAQHWGYTKDGGISWVDSSNGNSGYLPIITVDMQFLNDTTVIGFGGYGPNMFKSNNKGLNWVPINENIYIPISSLSSGCTVDANHWYAAGTGARRSQTGGGIAKSSNAGKTWDIVDSSLQGISCVRYYDSKNLYAVGAKGFITKTSDSGKTWLQDSSNTKLYLYKIVLIPGKAIAIGDSGIILMNKNVPNGIPEEGNHALEVNIYPNPSEGIFHISLSSSPIIGLNIQVWDIFGKLVYSKENACGSWFDLNLNNQKPGIYFLRVESNRKWQNYKLIIVK